MKVLLLGAGGFIGVNLTERLLADGVHEVTALDIHDEKIEHLINNPDLKYLNLNISKDEEEVDKLVAENDVIVDLVAFANPALYVTDPFGVYDLNYTQNMKVVEQCRQHKKRLVQFSTCEVYGITAAKAAEQFGLSSETHKCEFIEDETPLIMGPVKNHRWIYAAAKQLLERVLDALWKSEGFRFSVIRPFNFVGPRIDYLPSEEAGNPRVFSHFMDSLLYGNNPIKLVDGGEAFRAYTYIDDAVDWLRSNDPEPEKVDEPTCEAFSNLTGLPLPKKMNPKNKKKFMEESMDWLRNNNPDFNKLDHPTAEEVVNLAGVPMPPLESTAGALKKPVEDSVEWLRNNNPKMEDVDGPTAEALSNLTGVPVPKKMTPEKKKKFVDDAVDWLRKSNPDLSKLDEPTAEAITNLAGVPMPALVTSKEAVTGPMEDAVEWLRKNDPDLTNVDEPTVEAFTRLASLPLLPQKDAPKPKMSPFRFTSIKS